MKYFLISELSYVLSWNIVHYILLLSSPHHPPGPGECVEMGRKCWPTVLTVLPKCSFLALKKSGSWSSTETTCAEKI